MRGESGVNVSRFSAPLVGSPGNPVSLRRGRVKETKRRRDKGTKSQRDKGIKRLRVEGTKGQRDEETKRRREEETKRQKDKERKRGREEGAKRRRDKKTKRRRDEERKRQRDKKTKTTSPPIRVLFTSSSPPLYRSIRSIRVQKHSRDSFFTTVLHQGTPLCESSVKVNVEGTVRVGGKGRGCAVNLNYNTASSNNVFVRNPHIFIFHMTIFI